MSLYFFEYPDVINNINDIIFNIKFDLININILNNIGDNHEQNLSTHME